MSLVSVTMKKYINWYNCLRR